MKPALAFRQLHYPETWQDLPNGELIKKAIELELAPWWPKFFGYHLAKLGALSAEIAISNSTIKHQVSIGSANITQANSDKYHCDVTGSNEVSCTEVVGDIDDLPLQEHSVDVCLLSHALEFSLDPHHVVREANRVLIPNGYIVITGFNPLSLAGLNRLLPYRRNKTPWNEQFFTPMRVKDWLHLMGFEVIADQRCLHSSLSSHCADNNTQNKWANKISNKWHQFASRYLPALGSVYVIIAKKRVLPLTPIKPRWQIRPEFNPVKVPTMNRSRKTTYTHKKSTTDVTK
ncbi:class I SAM-dependent methyltransferase [Colwellia sp. E2M01]|uniref:class I SAM-dependent methyltransferase n=1 Tax=Colwellia sp. E2M01 TaxID=2841561 RepID=UPI001C08DBA8|nr:class I SAM-dependent methyltransferase [Colwellia sp. E2M01]MBU2870839.1 class I SAM-dependent methyltransferase [Colwellia sp. E2M01]